MMKVEIEVPEENTGDIIGDISSRRGRVEGMEIIEGTGIQKSELLFLWLKCSVMQRISVQKHKAVAPSQWNFLNMNKFRQTLKLKLFQNQAQLFS